MTQIFNRQVQSRLLDFAVEKAERSRCQINAQCDEPDDEARNPLDDYLHAVSVFSRTRRGTNPEDDDDSMVVARARAAK